MEFTTMPRTLVCTVGTSLEANLKRYNPDEYLRTLSVEDQNWFENKGLDPKSETMSQELARVQDVLKREDWPAVGRALRIFPPHTRLVGAEINSIAAMFHKNLLPQTLPRLVFLTSQTALGNQMGIILRSYFAGERCPLSCGQVLVHEITALQDEDPVQFQRQGLPNLIRLLGDQARQWSAQTMAINATGGYKAQIAFAVVFGQAMGIPVYYKHELFNEIIAFPKVPFTMDLSLVQDNLRFWANLAEPGALFSYEDLTELGAPSSKVWELMLPLLESEIEGGRKIYALSALGTIYWEAFCAQNRDLELEPQAAQANSGCRFRDDHFPKGFKIWAERVNKQYPFITGCHSLEYSGQGGMKFGFHEERGKLVGIYKDRTGFGARLEILTTCTNALERRYALRVLNATIHK